MAEKTASSRSDGRKQFLTVMRPDLITRVKKAALDKDVAAYQIVEYAVEAYLAAEDIKG